MINTILESFDIWTRSQTIKSNGRTAGVDNQRLLGIDKLRELIQELAVRGKLVPQDEKDEPASNIIENIKFERLNLIKQGKTQNSNDNLEYSDFEKPYSIPKTWVWTIVGKCFILKSGATFENARELEKGQFLYLKVADMNLLGNEVEITTSSRYINPTDKEKNALIPGGSIVFPKRGGAIATNKKKLVKTDLFVDLNTMALTPLKGIVLDYAYLWLKNLDLASLNTGTSVPQINNKDIAPLPFPIPPLAEQHRIVAKVDELMALCDQLEQQQTENNTTHHQLVELLLQNLTAATGPEAFANAWQRIATNFDTLFTTEYSIDQLKQTILQLAVMGKLVPQDPKDEPASELIKKINLDKIQNLIGFPELIDSELPYKIPNTWAWTIVGKCFELKSGTTFENTREQDIGHFMYLKVADLNLIGNEVNITTSSRYLNPTEKEKNALIPAGSIIFPKRGGAIATNKKKLVKTDVFVDLNIMALTPFKCINLDYAYAWLKGLDLAKLNSGTSVPQINNKDIAPLFFPLPPLAEQHRIVAKVDELFALCDALKERIKEAQETQGVLAEGVVEGVLG